MLRTLFIFSFSTPVWCHGEYQCLVKNDDKDISEKSGNVCLFDLACRDGQNCPDSFNDINGANSPFWAYADNLPSSRGGAKFAGQCKGNIKGPYPTNGVCSIDMKDVNKIVALGGPGGSQSVAKSALSSTAGTLYKDLWDQYGKYGLHLRQDGIWHDHHTVFLCLSEIEDEDEPALKPSSSEGGFQKKQKNWVSRIEAQAKSGGSPGCKYMTRMEGKPKSLMGRNVQTKFEKIQDDFWQKHGSALQGKTKVMKIVSCWANSPSSNYECYTRCMTVKFSDESPPAKEPVSEKPGVSEPSSEKPVSEEPSSEKPVSEEPSSEKPVSEEPSTEKPVSEDPSTEKPVSEELSPDDTTPSSKALLKQYWWIIVVALAFFIFLCWCCTVHSRSRQTKDPPLSTRVEKSKPSGYTKIQQGKTRMDKIQQLPLTRSDKSSTKSRRNTKSRKSSNSTVCKKSSRSTSSRKSSNHIESRKSIHRTGSRKSQLTRR